MSVCWPCMLELPFYLAICGALIWNHVRLSHKHTKQLDADLAAYKDFLTARHIAAKIAEDRRRMGIK